MTESNDLVIAPLGIRISRDFAPIDYVMDPAMEDLIRGSELEEGMVVLVEDHLVRGDPEDLKMVSLHKSNVRRIFETSRWCMVTKLEQGNVMSFIGVYGDGTKIHRQYSDRYCWFVKF